MHVWLNLKHCETKRIQRVSLGFCDFDFFISPLPASLWPKAENTVQRPPWEGPIVGWEQYSGRERKREEGLFLLGGLTVMCFLCGCQPVAYPSSFPSSAFSPRQLQLPFLNTTPPQNRVFLPSAPLWPLVPVGSQQPLVALSPLSLALPLTCSFSFFPGRESSWPTGLQNGGCTVLYCKSTAAAIFTQVVCVIFAVDQIKAGSRGDKLPYLADW